MTATAETGLVIGRNPVLSVWAQLKGWGQWQKSLPGAVGISGPALPSWVHDRCGALRVDMDEDLVLMTWEG